MSNQLKVGIVGLGLIGGSMARAYSGAGHAVLAHDIDDAAVEAALAENAICGRLTAENVAECDVIFLAIYPRAAIAWLRVTAPHLTKDSMVIDLCGTKRGVCGTCFAMAREYGFSFVGGHPMAGTQYSGFGNSKDGLFRGAPMVIVPENPEDETLLTRVRELLLPVGFGSITVSTAEKHDRIIAFTSQLAHVVSNAYVKSPNAQVHKGFSAGSYKDLTRVAWLNEQMWSELFMENSDYLTEEIDGIIHALTEYRDAMAAGDAGRLKALLRDGRLAKERVDRGSEDKA
ncbi:MAG: prephenate dehydrogenase [Clostridia bacterium]|nr:prephenate dehydrogenase [Clostridia bacterium]